jgi:hypothetical protein
MNVGVMNCWAAPPCNLLLPLLLLLLLLVPDCSRSSLLSRSSLFWSRGYLQHM